MTKKILNFRETPNPTILNGIRNNSSRDYRERIPEATQANQAEIAETLGKFPALKNEVIDALLNRIGAEVFRSNSWANPLTEFKKGMLPYGSTVEEIQVGLVRARVHDETRDSLEKDVFGRAFVDVQTSFHTVTRQNKYKITLDEQAFKRAFTSEFGLGKFMHEMMGALDTSDQWDEFLLMSDLLVKNYDANGYYKIQVSAVEGGDEAAAKELLVAIRAMRSRLGFISTKYNASKMPVAADLNDLIVITTPTVAASLDVDAYAAAFNLDRAKVPDRLVVIPEEHWPIEGAQAVLTTTEFFQVWDTYMDVTSMTNPDGRYTNWWQHHDSIISMSRFVPAVLFTTETVTPETNEPVTISSVTTPTFVNGLTGADTTTIERGYFAQIVSSAVSSVDGIGEGVVLTVDGANSQFTHITNTGALAIGVDETATSLTITATSVEDPTKSASATVEISGDIAVRYFDANITPDPGQPEPDPEP